MVRRNRSFRSEILSRIAGSLLVAFAGTLAVSAAEQAPSAGAPRGSASVPTPSESMRRLAVAPGFKLDLYAAEPLVQNIVSFCFDEKGRAFVVETHRRRSSVYDIRNHRDWLDSDLSFRSVEDRIQFFKSTLTPGNTNLPSSIRVDRNRDGVFDWHDLEVESERIRLLTDTNGDGVADEATTFADGFNSLVSGVAAGVMARHGKVWFTCVPDLWEFTESKTAGQAPSRKKLHSGFGVHIAFGGHDMHGLRMGPDGKVYFSIADRGLHVNTGDKLLHYPDTGSVLRCNPDGSELEVFAWGLRNPQELVFDQFGNLWTADNNGDGGDKARLVHVVEEGDSGWLIGWQWLPKMGAWNSEKLWHLKDQNTAAYLLPPIAHVGHGPAGFTFYPGTGMPASFSNSFFLADFPGGVRHFRVVPDGATYKIQNPGGHLEDNSAEHLEGKLLWGLSPTDVDFGPEGGLYVSDWIQGWEKTAAGRIFRVHVPEVDQLPVVAETRSLLASNLAGKTGEELIPYFSHPDMRVRMEAQFKLVEEGSNAVTVADSIVVHATNQLARIHGLWALNMLGKTDQKAWHLAAAKMMDADPEIRAQAAKVCADARFGGSFNRLMELLRDRSPRVAFQAAIALGRLAKPEACPALIELSRGNDDRDPYLRHAVVMALSRCADINVLLAAAQDRSEAVRLVSLLTMRRLHQTEIFFFLSDKSRRLVTEAARAIYDTPIEPAFPQLAELITQRPAEEPVIRRVLNVLNRVGSADSAAELARYAADAAAPEIARAEALLLLSQWEKPPVRDAVVGLWRPISARPKDAAVSSLKAVLPSLFSNAPPAILEAGLAAYSALAIPLPEAVLASMASQTMASDSTRIAALRKLIENKSAMAATLIRGFATSGKSALRKEASTIQLKQLGADAAATISKWMDSGTLDQKRSALQAIPGLGRAESEPLLLKAAGALAGGRTPPELRLDVLSAAKEGSSKEVRQLIGQYEKKRDGENPLGRFADCLTGGDAISGRRIFTERAEAACFRCHKVGGEGGDVGPDLSGIGKRQTREYILESIVTPNKQITKGYESATVTMQDGSIHSGVVKSENELSLRLNSPEDGLLDLKKSEIKKRDSGLSPMPEGMAELLSPMELRDLVEFIATTPAASTR